MASHNDDRLAELMQSLPQEIYDIVFDLTFTAEGKEVHINGDYLPPARLHVSQSFRKCYANCYYKNTIFYCHENDRRWLAKWLASLHNHDVARIREIRYDILPVELDTGDRAKSDTYELSDLRTEVARLPVFSRPGDMDCFHVRVKTRSYGEIWSNCPMRDCQR